MFVMPEIFDKARVELQRAERYRIFVSFICIDFSFVNSRFKSDSSTILSQLEDSARTVVRGCDSVSMMPDGCLALLYPETNRDGAELGARRVTEALRHRMTELTEDPLPEVIPLDIASFPDAAGAKTIDQLMSDLNCRQKN